MAEAGIWGLLLEAVFPGGGGYKPAPCYHAAPGPPLVNLKEGQQEAEAEKLEAGEGCGVNSVKPWRAETLL